MLCRIRSSRRPSTSGDARPWTRRLSIGAAPMAKSSNSGANGLSGMFPFGMPGPQGGSTPQVMPNVTQSQLTQPSGPTPAVSMPQANPNPGQPKAAFSFGNRWDNLTPQWTTPPSVPQGRSGGWWAQPSNASAQQNSQGLFGSQTGLGAPFASAPPGGFGGLFGSLGVPQVGSPGMPAMPNLPNLPAGLLSFLNG